MRTTVAAVLVVGLAMAVGALLLVAVLRGTLMREVRTAAELREQDLAALLASDASASGAGPLAVNETDELLIQVLDEQGRVVDASPNAAGMVPVARLGPGESRLVEVPVSAPIQDDGPFSSLAPAPTRRKGPRTVAVARSIEAVGETTAAVAWLLVVGLPLLLAVVAVTTWVVVGRALARWRRSGPRSTRPPPPPCTGACPTHRPTTRSAASPIPCTACWPGSSRPRPGGGAWSPTPPTSSAPPSPPSASTPRWRSPTPPDHGWRVGQGGPGEDLRLQRLAEDLPLLTQADEHTWPSDAARSTSTTWCWPPRRRPPGLLGRRPRRPRAAGGRGRRPRDPGGRPGAVFERFVRLDDGGSGLGLAHGGKLVAAHGGTVALDSSSLGRAWVEVGLPRPAEPDG